MIPEFKPAAGTISPACGRPKFRALQKRKTEIDLKSRTDTVKI